MQCTVRCAVCGAHVFLWGVLWKSFHWSPSRHGSVMPSVGMCGAYCGALPLTHMMLCLWAVLCALLMRVLALCVPHLCIIASLWRAGTSFFVEGWCLPFAECFLVPMAPLALLHQAHAPKYTGGAGTHSCTNLLNRLAHEGLSTALSTACQDCAGGAQQLAEEGL